MRHRVFCIGFVLTSCQVQVDPTPRDLVLDLPDEWASADVDSTPVRDQWWRDFSDPQLTKLVERAFGFNRDLAVAAARVARAAAEAKAAGAELGPSLDAAFGAGRERQNFIGLPIPGGGNVSSTFSSFGLGLDLSWEIDLWGRLRAGELRSQHQLEAAAADFRGARLSLAAQTSKGWFAVVEARAQLALAEETAELFQRSADRVRARFERGVRSSLDLRLALSEVETARAAVARARESLDRRTRALQVLIGTYPNGVLDEVLDLPTMPGPVPAGIPAHILSRRPDLVAAERRLAAADAGAAQARAALYPALSLTSSGGTRSDDIADVLDFDFRVWSIGANLVTPIFDSGRRRANVEIGDAQRNEAWAAWAGSVLIALGEVESALAAEEHLASQEGFVAAASREATAARTLSDDRYARGLIDIITLLTAQRRDVTARSQLIELHRLRLDVRVDLLLALGGGVSLEGDDVEGAP